MTRREPAWRVFAGEVNAASVEERAEGSRAASFLVSPFGARMNRVLIAGELGPAASVGRDPSQPFWRAPLADPTGNIPVTAGGFQPRALSALQQFTMPGLALVVGKVHLFQGRDGRATSSVRAEEIRPATRDELSGLEAEAREATVARLDLLERLRGDPAAPENEGNGNRPPPTWIEGARAAITAYPSADLSSFRRLVLQSAEGGRETEALPRAPSGSVTITPAPGPPARPKRGPIDHGQESVFLDLIDELSEGSADGYADLREALRLAAGRGIGEHRVEEILGALEESGVLEEPIVGKLRRA